MEDQSSEGSVFLAIVSVRAMSSMRPKPLCFPEGILLLLQPPGAPDTTMPSKAQLSERLLQVTITNTLWPGSVLGEVWTVSVHISLAVQLVSSQEGFWIVCFAL
ncbi:unnamed protein product [Natator depressus]